MITLTQLTSLPEGLLQHEASEIHQMLEGPTLIHLEGRRPEPLFVSVLMHGNETVGWEAVRHLLPQFSVAGGRRELPRSLSLFIANVSAAAEGVRALEGQPDYNRVWPGCEMVSDEIQQSETRMPEQDLMSKVIDIMRDKKVFASIDVHNNTGINPHYACVNIVREDFLRLATLFSRTVVFFTDPCQVASMAMAKLCPSVTLECGKVGQKYGVEHAAEYLDACLHLQTLDGHAVAEQDIDLFHTVATVKVPENISFGFEESDVELQFSRAIEQLNFREIHAGTYFASVSGLQRIPLDIYCEHKKVDPQTFFDFQDQDVVFNKSVMPSMLTLNKEVIRQDCLCYLMERYQKN